MRIFYTLQVVYRYLSEIRLSSKCSFSSISFEGSFYNVPVGEGSGSRMLLKLLKF